MKPDLNEFRHSLLALHKSLMDYEKREYEGKFGKITSPGVLLGLLTDNPSFAWLRQISELIVSIDELIEGEESEMKKYQELISYCKNLFSPGESSTDFAKKYLVAIAHDPQVALSHGKTNDALKKISTSL